MIRAEGGEEKEREGERERGRVCKNRVEIRKGREISRAREAKNGEENGEFVAYVEERAAGRGSSHAPRSCLDTGQHRVALR